MNPSCTGSDCGTSSFQCNPRINGSLTEISLTSSSSNPLISANCLPSDVQYNWTTTKDGNSISIPSLSGANSNPNFISLGRGIYLISLTATTTDNKTWTSSQPLTIRVEGNAPSLAVNCVPRLNNTATSITITTAGPNPLVTANCTPSAAQLTWTVYQNGNVVTVNGLSGASSTPNFTSLPFGTYEIFLTATAPSYNAYSSPSPLTVVVNQIPLTYRQVDYTQLVQASNNKVDIIVVFDDSRSMLPDNTKLAERLQGFVSGLNSSGLDWQMCATITRAQDAYNDGNYYWGASQNWVNYVGTYKWVLNQGASDPYSIFTSTVKSIGAGWAGTDDERAIKALYWNAEYSEYNHCYREGAAIAGIIISDEDERSVGGDASQVFYSGEFKYLDADDTPTEYLNKIRQKFGADKRVSINSIIVKPGDTACMADQDNAIQSDGTSSKSHYGYKYNELSLLTGGAVTSICSSDYSSNLYYFRDRVISTQGSVPLECAPAGDIEVSIAPPMSAVSTTITNNTLYFTPQVPVGRTIHLRYKCAQN